MGRVWRATDVVLHREVAIKELVPPPGLTADERREMRDRSLREARAIARLNNINVVRVFDVLRTDADPWIVMEYVASRSLQDTLAEDGPFPPVRAAEIGLGVLNALRAAHRAGVVHRDVKPGNVLLGEDGRVVLTDFGLATVPGDPNVTRTGLVLGSPAYIAPERARDGTAGPAADLWSLGATLYAAVEGTSPFARPTAIATLAALATENPPQSRNAGPMKPVLNGLLRKDPAHRINADEAERLLLRATGRRSKLSFPMSPTMRRPGVGRERPALPGPPPVVPGTATGSAPVVPGPRPPVTPAPGRVARGQSGPAASPYVEGGPAAPPDRPVFAPGKASVGRPPQRPDAPARLDATRLDTPAVQNPSRGTGNPAPPNSVAPAKTPIGESAQKALGPGTRGVFGTISAAEIAYRRGGRPTASDDPSADEPSPDDRATVGQAAVAASPAPPTATMTSPGTSGTQVDDRVTFGQPAAEGTEIAATAQPGEQVALDRAAADWRARDRARAGTGTVFDGSGSDVPSAKSDAAVEAAPGRDEESGMADDAAIRATGADEPASAATPEAADVEALSVGAGATETTEDAEPIHPGISVPDSSEATDLDASSAAADGVGVSEQIDDVAAVDVPVQEDEPQAESAGPAPAASAAGTETASAAGTETASAAGTETGSAAVAGEPAAFGKPAIAGKPTGNKPPVGARAGAASSKASRRKGRGRAAPAKATSAPRAQKADVTGNQDVTAPAAADEAGKAENFAVEPSTAVAEPSAVEAPASRGGAADPATPDAPASRSEAADPATPDAPAPTGGAAGPAAPDAQEGAAQRTIEGSTEEASELRAEGAPVSRTARTSKQSKAADPDPGHTRSAPATVAAFRATGKRSGANGVINMPVARDSGTQPAGEKAQKSAEPGPERDRTAQPVAAASTTVLPSHVPGFGAPNRPAWTPMAVPPSAGKKGLTIFGTTLTRNQTLVGGVLVLALIALLAVLIPKAFGSGDDHQGAPAAIPTKATAAPTKATATKAAPTKAAAPAPPPSSTDPSPSASTPATGAMPAGWHLYQDPTGFQVPVPDGVSITRQGSEVYFRKDNRLLIVDQTDQPKPDPVADWTQQEQDRAGSAYQNYHRIKIVAVNYFLKAADWEFTYTTSSGNDQHADKRGVITGAHQAYGLSWYTSPDDWAASQADLQVIYQGFKPKS